MWCGFMDDHRFTELVEAVRGWFMPGHVPKWDQSPAETAADSYLRVFPPHMREPHLDDLIARSTVSQTAWDAVNLIAENALRSGDPMPAGLAAWVADVLSDQRKRECTARLRPPKKGDPVSNLANRDRVIAGAVEHVAERFELNPTRSGTKGERCTAAGGSACDVVGAAATMGYKAIERIWLSYRSTAKK